MVEHFTQGEDILVCLSPAHLLALSEGKNVKVEILGQSQCLTSYQSTKIMNEKAYHLHYSALKTSCPAPYGGTLYSRRGYSRKPG
jgi:hypothetical protein